MVTLKASLYERLLANSRLQLTDYDPDNPCIVWTKFVDSKGYGHISIESRMVLVHRAAFMLFQPIPEGLVFDHLCRNPPCFNPNHLEPVTGAVNNLRGEGVMADYARRTHCPQGHEYAGENLWLKSSANGDKGAARRCLSPGFGQPCTVEPP